MVETLDYSGLDNKNLTELRDLAKEQGISGYTRLKKKRT